jgi:plastocyanin
MPSAQPIVWMNYGSDPHTVDNAQGKFKSAVPETNDKFEFRFAEAREYPFFCRFHPKMTGKIICAATEPEQIW